MTGATGLTGVIADIATGLSTARLRNELSVRTLKAALSAEQQMAQALLAVVDASAYGSQGQARTPPARLGESVDLSA